MSEESAFEEGPCLVEEGQYGDPDYYVITENDTIDVQEVEDLDKLMVNPDVIPLIADTFTVHAADIDQNMQFNDIDFEETLCAQ
jgi:hypothetical protein